MRIHAVGRPLAVGESSANRDELSRLPVRHRQVEERHRAPHAGGEHPGDAADEHEQHRLKVQHQIARRGTGEQFGPQEQPAAQCADGCAEEEATGPPGRGHHRPEDDRQTLPAANGHQALRTRPTTRPVPGAARTTPRRQFPQARGKDPARTPPRRSPGRSGVELERRGRRLLARACRLHRFMGQEQQTAAPRAPLRSGERGLASGAEQLHGAIRNPGTPNESIFSLERNLPPCRVRTAAYFQEVLKVGSWRTGRCRTPEDSPCVPQGREGQRHRRGDEGVGRPVRPPRGRRHRGAQGRGRTQEVDQGPARPT